MKTLLEGKAFVYGKNVDTDQIYPAPLLTITDADKVGQHAMEGVDPDFVRECRPGDIIVASTNFGCGSSREHAAVTLKADGVGAVLAESFGRIFYRNAINLGIPAIVCAKGFSENVKRGDELKLDLKEGTVTNLTTGKVFSVEAPSEYMMEILRHGGIKPMMREKFGQKKDGV